MAEADCASCAADGNRSCDECGNVAFPRNVLDSAVYGLELCGYCLSDRGAVQTLPEGLEALRDSDPKGYAKLFPTADRS